MLFQKSHSLQLAVYKVTSPQIGITLGLRLDVWVEVLRRTGQVTVAGEHVALVVGRTKILNIPPNNASVRIAWPTVATVGKTVPSFGVLAPIGIFLAVYICHVMGDSFATESGYVREAKGD